MHPFCGQSGHDRMLRGASFHEEGMLFAMAPAGPRGREWLKFAVPETEIRPGLFIAVVPTAQPDHFVVSFPIGKRVIRGMHTDKAAALADITLKSLLCFGGPWLTVVIANDHLVIGESRVKTRHVFPLSGGGGDLHRK